MRWTWDRDKAAKNRAKHGLSFETALLVFDDPLHASKPEPHPDGDRWQTIGLVGSVFLLVVHTWRRPKSKWTSRSAVSSAHGRPQRARKESL